MIRLSSISKKDRIAVYLLLAVMMLRLILHVLTYVSFTPDISYTGNDFSIITGVIFYQILFAFLIIRILQKNKWAKFFALLLIFISFIGLLPSFYGTRFTFWLLVHYVLIIQFSLLVIATILLFGNNKADKTNSNG